MGLKNCKPDRINNENNQNNHVFNHENYDVYYQTYDDYVYSRRNIDYKINFNANPNNDKFFIESVKYTIKNEHQNIFDYIKFNVNFYLEENYFGNPIIITNINCKEGDFNIIFKNYIHFNSIETIPLDLCLNKDCAICLDLLTDITNSKKMPVKLKCGHMFHYSCIEKWHQNKPDCPICRKSINNICIQ